MSLNNRFLGTLLFSASLIGLGHATPTVTCATEEVNLIQNPSFETGDLSDWTYAYPYGYTYNGAVVAGDASDGDDYLSVHSLNFSFPRQV